MKQVRWIIQTGMRDERWGREMRVFCSFSTVEKHSSDPFESWADRDFSNALTELNCNLDKFDWALPSSIGYEGWLKKNKKRKNEELLTQIKKSHRQKTVDMCLFSNDSRFIFPETIEKIKQLGILTVNYNCDDVNAFHRIEDVAPVYDYNWTNQLTAIHKYKKIGAQYIYTPFGANPQIYKPYRLSRKYDVTFVGRNMGYRGEFLEHIKDSGIDLHVWGTRWPSTIKDIVYDFCYVSKRTRFKYVRKQISNSLWYISNFRQLDDIFGPPLSYKELIKMYSRSKISLNFSGGFDSEMYDFAHANKSMKLRDMEATMSGAFYLTEYSDGIGKLFDIGTEIECFRNKKELIEKIKYYLENPEEAEAIRKAGYQKASRNYTWKKNFELLFEKMGII